MNRALLLGMVVLGALFGAAGMWIAGRVAPGDLNGADRARVERVVRDYVLANPELIPQAMQKLQEKDAARAVAASRGAITEPYAGAWIGNPKGDVTLVEYYDYNCGFCRASLPVIDQLVAGDRNLRIVFKELPVLSEESRVAARAALAAATQGRFKAFHDALYAAGPVSDATIAQAAKASGVDVAKVPADADAVIRENMETAAKLGINGTPSWVVGDQVLTGALPIDRLREAIAKARATG
ncbi:MAG: DsbA family protein [Sphingomonas adhaesiva]|uniref:DsbA family protein n=1 Tax=Sphingomonas adhaesiva TaxID=28212 RepID=UPI002FF75953